MDGAGKPQQQQQQQTDETSKMCLVVIPYITQYKCVQFSRYYHKKILSFLLFNRKQSESPNYLICESHWESVGKIRSQIFEMAAKRCFPLNRKKRLIFNPISFFLCLDVSDVGEATKATKAKKEEKEETGARGQSFQIGTIII